MSSWTRLAAVLANLTRKSTSAASSSSSLSDQDGGSSLLRQRRAVRAPLGSLGVLRGARRAQRPPPGCAIMLARRGSTGRRHPVECAFSRLSLARFACYDVQCSARFQKSLLSPHKRNPPTPPSALRSVVRLQFLRDLVHSNPPHGQMHRLAPRLQLSAALYRATGSSLRGPVAAPSPRTPHFVALRSFATSAPRAQADVPARPGQEDVEAADVLPRAEHAVISAFGMPMLLPRLRRGSNTFCAASRDRQDTRYPQSRLVGSYADQKLARRPLLDWRRAFFQPYREFELHSLVRTQMADSVTSSQVGPMRAAKIFVTVRAKHPISISCASTDLALPSQDLKHLGILEKVHKLKIGLYGSLAATGKGHMTPQAVVLGLEGAHSPCDFGLRRPASLQS